MDLVVHRDKLVNSIARWRSEDANRASDVGEQREDIKHVIELTGVHSKALSWIRALDKMEPDKRDDVLRSFDALRNDIMEPHWGGQKTPDMFEQPPVEPATKDAPRKPSYEPTLDVGDREIASEGDAFSKHLAEVMPEDAA